MINFVEYVVSELKSKRLSKADAIALIKQYSRTAAADGDAPALHPLLHRNTSDLAQQSFTTRFSGDEFFLRDHRVRGKRVLPAVAYLEMARIALLQALPWRAGTSVPVIRNAIWAQPVALPEHREVVLGLSFDEEAGEDEDRVDFELYSADDVVHFQGQAGFEDRPPPARLDIAAIARRMRGGDLPASELYATIAAMGIELGPAHRGVREVHRGEGELLARIRLPDAVDQTLDDYVLHPSLLDSAVQAGMSLVFSGVDRNGAPPLPFALESLRVHGGFARDMLAWVRYSSGSGPNDKVVKLDIDVCDTEGEIRAQMSGFSSRVAQREASSSIHIDCVYAEPFWAPATRAEASTAAEASAYDPTRSHLILCGFAPAASATAHAVASVIATAAREEGDIAARYAQAVAACLDKAREILESKPKQPVLLQVAVPDDEDHRMFIGLSGLLKTAAQENPKLTGQLVFVDAALAADADSADPLARSLRAERLACADAAASAAIVRLHQGERQVLAWREAEARAIDAPSFKDDGVYLITGGLGGLGLIFARALLEQAREAVVVLTGRGEADEAKAQRVAALCEGAKPRAFYRRLDLTDAAQTEAGIAAVVAEFGRLDGILHSAGMAADNFILKKTADETSEVLAPKVAGTSHLDRASRALALDFFALFSSVSAVFGNAGQADYAAANGFMDGFAAWRNARVEAGERRGRTVSIAWPLWAEGGMQVSAAALDTLERAIGMRPMRSATGIEALRRALLPGAERLLVMEGDGERIRKALFGAPEQTRAVEKIAAPATATAASAPTADDLVTKTRQFLREQFSIVLKLAPGRIDPLAPLENYGIDSILAMELTSQLELSFGSLPKTLFFEHQTIRELADHFVGEYTGKLAEIFALPANAETGAQTDTGANRAAPALAEALPPMAVAATRKRLQRARARPASKTLEPIAIVGLSGRYPQAADLREFWINLRDGRDCITEVPADRWDWREYYSEDRTAEGRHYSKWGGFISGVDEFDPLFFNIPPVDAELIDPQERLFLQHAWMAVEDAGYTRAGLHHGRDDGPSGDDQAGQVGVYVGVMYGEYQLFGAESSLLGKRIGLPVSYASIANRVSYVFNVHGPSMTLDTMCSSSLTAIHLACQDLKHGRTHLAIAGGVNVTIHPNKYLILSAGQYISGDGHCQSFGEGGDGYIPGEGVGAVVLKRLADAERDGNHIYGVIRGSALNHGGKTNGYSVPNPKAQAAVIAQALKEYAVDPRRISYIEAHGTGTKLGDPIEIAALGQVFRKHTRERQFCAIGSVKSNIGHCESAAGIAGLTKVLLQMKHRMLVPSLHSAKLNPNIDFEQSPFVVNQQLRPWERPVIDDRPVARLAGISSFGAGGSNAHLLVEEYDGPMPAANVVRGEMLVPLSARTDERLRQKAADLAAFLAREEETVDLHALAYTLQVGREAMDARLCLVVDSLQQLREGLAAFLDGERGARFHHGRVEKGEDGMAVIGQDEDMMEAIGKWIARGKHARLAEVWVKGLDFDWRKLHAGRRPSLISLPTYPFAKGRYWISKPSTATADARPAAAALHPLLHANTSDLYGQRYESVFGGGEFFLADHRIDIGGDRRRVLPGVAALEMARAAAAQALPDAFADGRCEIRNVIWAQPVVVDGASRVALALAPAADDAVDFEINSGEIGTEVARVHCQGQVAAAREANPGALELGRIRARMTAGRIPAAGLYAAYAAMGIHYGPSFTGVVAVDRGERELLAELRLPEVGGASAGDAAQAYVLHPALLDSALQAAIGLAGDLDALPRQPAIPFALDRIAIDAPLPAHAYAWVRYADTAHAQDSLSRIDVDLCDAAGKVCVRLRGLASRVMAADVAADAGTIGCLLAQPEWEALQQDAAAPSPAYERHLVLACGLSQADLGAIAARMPEAEVRSLATGSAAGEDDDERGIARRYRAAALDAFDSLRGILTAAPQGKVLLQVLVAKGGDGELHAGLSGLLDTARIENPNVIGQVVLIARELGADARVAHLRALCARPNETLLDCDRDGLRALRWQPRPLEGAEESETSAESAGAAEFAESAYRNAGVYLITGGLGGLGLLFAADIMARTRDATIVFTGRSAEDADKQATLARLSAQTPDSGARLVYRKLDVSNAEDTRTLVASVVDEFGGLNGVIHSAGMIRDGFIVRKTAEEFADVLEPKVAGTAHLDRATRDLDLDFMVLFSSLASALGNVGQADYAAANGFMDRFAEYRNRLVAAGRRRGRTVAIGWPLWREGGMHIDAQTEAMLTAASGMVPLSTANGIRAFHRSLELGASQVLVVEGQLERLRHVLRHRHAPVAAAPATEVAPAVADTADAADTSGQDDAKSLLEKTQTYLGREFAELLKIPAHEIDPKAPLEKYGIDSVLTMKLTNQLERSFGSLSKTLFFEYQTIASLAAYLVKAFPQIVREKTGVSAVALAVAQKPAQAAPRIQAPRPAQAARARLRFAGPAHVGAAAGAVGDPGDIAIVGMSGRYPQAENLSVFWDNLKHGRDCITEIPEDRWNGASYFHPARNQPGKTYSKWGGFLSGVDRFDALFFSISPKEAELIDPQERLFLETAWETIEDAGYGKDALAQRRVGVYVGVMWGQYELYGVAAPEAGVPSSSFASVANRVSYVFDLRGPSMALDTMCSSSLTAIHLACEDLRKGAIEAAIAGGVNVSVHPNKYLNLSQGNFASTDGRCRSFGEGGDGYVPGEGVGALLLKPLRRALEDGDHVYAVIRASAVNHGGKTNGYTVPNPVAQSELIVEALRKAGVAPESIGYLETHGTGTSLGDPIEITGLVRAYEEASADGDAASANRTRTDEMRTGQYCPIGSVKSNIGHLESAAGIAAVTKVLLQFKHRQLVPSLHAERLNPNIAFERTPFYVQTALSEWKRDAGHPRRAGVSSFGAGGANAHLVLEEFIETRERPSWPRRPELFVLSARNRAGLRAYVAKTATFLQADDESVLAEIAFTAQTGRTPMQERLAVVAADKSALIAKLRQWLGESASETASRRTAAVEDVYEGNARDAVAVASTLTDGDTGAAFLRALLDQRDLAKLAKLWVSGIEIEWGLLYPEGLPLRVSLPTYPFARERYWIAAPAAPLPAAAVATHATPSPSTLSYYRSEWMPAASIAQEAIVPAAAPIVFLGADDEVLPRFRRFAGDGPTVEPTDGSIVTVACAASYRRLNAMAYQVDPDDAAGFETMVADLAAAGMLPATVVLYTGAGNDADLESHKRRGVFALHHLCRALMLGKTRHAMRILCIEKPGSTLGAALHEALAGYLRSLALENPKFSWKVVAVGGDAGPEEIARSLCEELADPHWHESEVRRRYESAGGSAAAHRQVRALRRHQVLAGDNPIRQDGVYLITGGLGGLGHLFGRHLARRYNARLVMTGRSPLDASLQAALDALRAQGGDAIYVRADVSIPEQAQAAIDEVKRRYGRIDGVLHSAGAHRDAYAIHKTREDMQSVFAAKIAGAINLDAATRNERLDLFVLFSSLAGSTGNLGQCDYAFANRFLDGFAEQRQSLVAAGIRTGRTLSIGWPYWEDGGMRIADSDLDMITARTGLAPLPAAEGVEAWEALLRGTDAHALALYGDAAKIETYLIRGVQRAATAEASPRMAETGAVLATGAGAQDLRADAEAYLKKLLSEEIKLPVERIDAQERFESFGVDSMMISRINAALERDIGDLPKTLFYEYATIEELANYLVREAAPALARNFGARVETTALPMSQPMPPQATPSIAAAEPARERVQTRAVGRSEDGERAEPAHTDLAHSESAHGESAHSERIAIIGIDAKFPKSSTLESYWNHLKEGRDLIEEVPRQRWDPDWMYDPDPQCADRGGIYCRHGGFVDDVDAFDAAFFNITPEDARLIDPQERMFLQSVWAAFEDAGYSRETLKARHPKAKSADVGVFVGVTTNSYQMLAPEEWSRGNLVTPGAMPWSIANRVSYVFDFQGPSIPIDTACSSSLVAIHLACESLMRGECQAAVAGGVNLYLHPSKYQSLCRKHMLATHGRCRSFGAGDDGFVPGEGIGAVVLKPLSAAVADRDHIYGVVAASAYEHSGRSNGYSAPNPASQANLIEETMRKAGIHPESIGYVEGHGTGTQLGDSLEVVSLTQAFRKHTAKKRFCALGSVKANAGHAESAAGIAGVAKILMQFRHGQLAPTIHSRDPNPDIDFAESPFYLQHALSVWPDSGDAPRRALINSFGAGGVNACLILEDYRPSHQPPAASARGPQLIVLSARDDVRLREMAGRLADWLDATAQPDLESVAQTLRSGREAMEARLAFVTADVARLREVLRRFEAGESLAGAHHGFVEAHRRKRLRKTEEIERIAALLANGELDAVAQLWTDGCELPWHALQAPGSRARHVPLPTYPFAKTRYWVSDANPHAADTAAPRADIAPTTAGTHGMQGAQETADAAAQVRGLHPLISHNASTLKETCFVSVLDARGYYGRDHRVGSESLFPGAGFLELAGVAGAMAGESPIARIEDVVWVQPLRLGAADTQVRTCLSACGNSAEFVIVSFDDDQERVVHCEGRIHYGDAAHAGDDAQTASPLQELIDRATKTLSSAECYALFRASGFEYGPTFRSIGELHIGEGYALSRLSLAEQAAADFEEYILHPSLIDGALQTVAGLAAGSGSDAPRLPFALGEVEILRPMQKTCYAYAVRADADTHRSSDIEKYDIALLSEKGETLVRLKNFYVRALRAQSRNSQPIVSDVEAIQ